MNNSKPQLGPDIDDQGRILAPSGRPVRSPFSGQVLGPDGAPALVSVIAQHNIRNRARRRAELGHWQERFPIDARLELRGIRFEVREKFDDFMVLGTPHMEEIKGKWYDRFALGQIYPLYGFEFQVMDIYSNSLHLRCRGQTGQARKRGR